MAALAIAPVRTAPSGKPRAQAAQWARTPGDAERRYEVALIPIDGWQVFFYQRGGGNSPARAVEHRHRTGDPSTGIPGGICLQLTLARRGAERPAGA